MSILSCSFHRMKQLRRHLAACKSDAHVDAVTEGFGLKEPESNPSMLFDDQQAVASEGHF